MNNEEDNKSCRKPYDGWEHLLDMKCSLECGIFDDVLDGWQERYGWTTLFSFQWKFFHQLPNI